MNVMDVISILKKYNLYDVAKAECKKRKIDESPYDMQGHYDVYCDYLSKKWVEFRNKKNELQKIKCKEWATIPNDIKPLHDDCYSTEASLKNKYFKDKCEYYNEIEKLDNAMKELAKAESVLKDAAEHDVGSR